MAKFFYFPTKVGKVLYMEDFYIVNLMTGSRGGLVTIPQLGMVLHLRPWVLWGYPYLYV